MFQSNLIFLVLALSWAWLFLFGRMGTCAQVAVDRVYALTLVASLWMLGLAASGLPQPLVALLILPVIPVFLVAFWQGLRRTWAAWQVFGPVSRNRKVA